MHQVLQVRQFQSALHSALKKLTRLLMHLFSMQGMYEVAAEYRG
jgi:hypothetical protein